MCKRERGREQSVVCLVVLDDEDGDGTRGEARRESTLWGKASFPCKQQFLQGFALNDLRRCVKERRQVQQHYIFFFFFRHLHGLVAFSMCCISEQKQQMNLGDWR